MEGHVVEREDSHIVLSITASIKPMFDNVPQSWPDYFISRVPERLRSVKPEAYTPLIVSIGPFHHRDDRLKTMEHLKTQYLHSLLRRHPEISLDRYVKELLKLETRARNCYAETIPYKKEEFVQMLVLDGCFLVELFRQYNDPTLWQDNDQLFKNHWIFNAVHRDVLLLENQIPIFVLEALFHLTPAGSRRNSDHYDLIKVFLGHHKLLPCVDLFLYPVEGEQLLLSALKNITASERFRMQTIDQPQPYSTHMTFIPTATELSRVGVKFAESNSLNLFDVFFYEKGVLFIPSLVVDARTESFLRNLIALEQTHGETTTIEDQNQSHSDKILTISAYVTLMDCLVNTSTDVALLRDQRILHNLLGDDEEVAQLFNKLRIGMIMNPYGNCFSEVFQSVNDYYRTKWNVWRAMFIREFWSTPWKKTSLLAAVFLLLFTFVQTVCSFLQVLPHWSN